MLHDVRLLLYIGVAILCLCIASYYIVYSLPLHHNSTGTVCNQTGKVNELQANIDAVKREVDMLRNTSKLLLDHYMLPHIQSMDE